MIEKKKIAINMTLPIVLHDELKRIASLTHTPLATFIREVLAIYVRDRKEEEQKKAGKL